MKYSSFFIIIISLFMATLIQAQSVNINGIKAKNAQVTEKVELISRKSVIEILRVAFHEFYELLRKAGYLSALEGANSITVFAPTDQAVENLKNFIGNEAFNNIFNNPSTPEAKEKLQKILQLHIAPNTVMAADIMGMNSIQPYGDRKLRFSTKNGVITINDSSAVVEADILGANGVVHAIDAVIMP